MREHGDERRRQLEAEWARINRYARSLTRDLERARDAAQEAAVRVLAARTVPPDPPAYRRFVYQTLRHLLIDEVRKAQRERLIEVPNLVDWSFDERTLSAISVQQALDNLPPILREVITLVDLDGFRYAEAAEVMGVPVGTVMSRLFRGRAALLLKVSGTTVRVLPVRYGTKD